MKSLIIFDLEGTLAESKSSLDAEMATLLGRLLGIVDVAIISGGAWRQFEKQVLAFLPHDERLKRLSLLPPAAPNFIASTAHGRSSIPKISASTKRRQSSARSIRRCAKPASMWKSIGETRSKIETAKSRFPLWVRKRRWPKRKSWIATSRSARQ
jgi:hypothetical protein